MSQFCTLGAFCDCRDRTTGRPAESNGYNLCSSCSENTVGDVAALLYDFVDLSQIIARRDAHSDVKIARPKPSSIPPIDLAVDTLRSDIERTLTLAEAMVRFAQQLPPRNHKNARAGYNVDQAVKIVLPHLDALAGTALGPGVINELRWLHRQARTLLGRNELKIALPGACPKCRASHALSRVDGSDTVSCGSCEFRMTREQYQRAVTLVVTEIVPIPARLSRNQQQ